MKPKKTRLPIQGFLSKITIGGGCDQRRGTPKITESGVARGDDQPVGSQVGFGPFVAKCFCVCVCEREREPYQILEGKVYIPGPSLNPSHGIDQWLGFDLPR